MSRFTTQSTLVLLLTFTSIIASAEDLTNQAFGFRVKIPDIFHKIATAPSEPDTLYKSVDRVLNQGDPPTAIQIQRLRGTISPHQRLKLDEMPKIAGLSTTLEEITWSALRLDVTRQVMPLPDQTRYVAYGIQFPLSDEAVQLHVGGPIAKDEEVRVLFKEVVASFRNTKPLAGGASAPVGRLLTKEERISRLLSGIARMAITLVVLASIVIAILRSRRKKFAPKI